MKKKTPATPATDPIARGHRIRMARQFAGLTAKALAKEMDYSNTTLSGHESGKRPLENEAVLQKICEITRVNLNWLYSGEGEPFNDPELKQTFYKQSGAIIHSNTEPFSEQAFLQLYDELRTLTHGKGLTEREIVALATKAYTYLSESSLSAEDLLRLVPGAAKLAFRLRHGE